MPLRIESAQAADLCTAAINQVRLWAAQKNVRLSERIVEEAVVNADPEVTVRVLVNLLSNAITHAPEGSVVTVRLEERDESRFAVSVQDEGPGIPNEWAERVFDTYAQVDRDSSMPRGGTGLGLAFSKRAIQAQGGRIWMESGVEGGTIVTFTLPRAQEGETLSRPASRKRQ